MLGHKISLKLSTFSGVKTGLDVNFWHGDCQFERIEGVANNRDIKKEIMCILVFLE